MKKLISSILIVAFLAALICTTPAASQSEPMLRPQYHLEGIDGTPFLDGVIAEDAQFDTGNPYTVVTYDFYYDSFYLLNFELVAVGEHCNVWVGLSPDVWDGGYHDYYDPKGPGLDDDEWHFAYPWTSTGFTIDDWTVPPGYLDVIYGKNITYLLNEFDNNIWETDTTVFGEYEDRPGPFGDYKIQILIFNLRDGLFWDPVTAPYFIQGYFWSFISDIMNANIIHIDTWQWYARLGPGVARPYQYEGVFAHEFQHLIHHDVDANEMTWVNEGCSDFAMYICGYGFPSGHIGEYLLYWWDTSLVIWEDYLSDYGAAFLWTFYIYEHYGGVSFIWDLVHEQANGIEGYNNVLQAYGVKKDFDEIFQDWAIANYLDDTSFANGIYGYYDLEIPSFETDWYSIPWSIWMWEYYNPNYFDTQVDEYPNVGYNYPWGSSLPYVVNYVEFYEGAPELEVYFDGDDGIAPVPAHSGIYEWYSGGVSYSWFRLGQTFDIPETGATLKFWSYFEIEQDWDYGYVEIHDLDTGEWYTLPGTATVSTLPYNYGTDNPNCPDEFEPTAYYDAGRWNAFTGSTVGWYQEEMDLSPFNGHTIELYFTYWTDPYTLELGWIIDDIEIPEIGFFDDIESGPDGWTYNGWSIAPIPNDFEVNFVQKLTVSQKGGTKYLYHIDQMHLNDETEEGQQLLYMINTKTTSSGPALMVVANQPGYEHTFRTFYWFIADPQPFLM